MLAKGSMVDGNAFLGQRLEAVRRAVMVERRTARPRGVAVAVVLA